MPQNLPAWTAQVGAAAATAKEVVVLEVVGEVWEVGFEDVSEVDAEVEEVGVLVDVIVVDVGVDFEPVDDEPLDVLVEVLEDFVLDGGVLVEVGPVVDVEEEVDVPETDFGVVVELDVDVEGADETSVVEVETTPPGVRYQFASGS